MSIDLEVEVSGLNNADSQSLEVGEYGAEVAKEYADKAFEYAESAKDSKNLAESWAESTSAPTGEGTRSAKSWSDISRQWAESGAEPDGVVGAKSSKTWSNLSKDYANAASESVIAAKNSASASAASAKASSDSAKAAALSETNAASSAVSAKQSADTAATALTKLENVDLPLKADVASPTFTGTPKVPTAAVGNNSQLIANTAFVQAAVAALVASAPGTLDTLKELAAALGNDPNFATTITNLIADKLDKTANAVSATKAAQDGNGNNIVNTYATKNEVNGGITNLAKVASTGSYNDLLNRPTIPSKTSQLTNDSNYVAKDAGGNVTIAGTLTAAKVVNAYYNDYAEFFPRGEASEPGDIIALADTEKESYVKATKGSVMVVGIHSDEYAQIIGGETDENGNVDIEMVLQKYIPVALAGSSKSQAQGGENAAQTKKEQRRNTWTNEDGSIRPISKWSGVSFTDQQKADYVAGKAVKLENVTDKQGFHATMYIKFNPEKGRPYRYDTNPDNAQQVAPSNESRTQVAVNNDGKTNEATKNLREPLQKGQTNPKDARQQQQQEKPQKKTGKGMKM